MRSRPPADWLPQVADLIHARPELAGIGCSAASEAVTA